MVVSTKDNLQAQRFMRHRVRAALIEGDPDSGERPLSRLGLGTFAGIFAAVALLAVAGIVGVLRPGVSTAWAETGALILESETGSRFVSLAGTLHPVLNYASARLILGEQLHGVSVSAGTLTSVPHGPTVGIPSAPDSLPDPARMAGSTWSVCAVGDTDNSTPFRMAILPGWSPDGRPVPSDTGYLLRSGTRTYLLAQGRAFPIDDRWSTALGFRDAAAIPVESDFVAALPAGQPIVPATVAGLGEPGPALPGSLDPTTVGTLFVDRFDARYLMTRAGLTTLTPLQANLLLADPRLSAAYSGHPPAAVPISQAQVTEASPTPRPQRGDAPEPPARSPTPAVLPSGDQICIRYPPDGVPAIVVAGTGPPGPLSTGRVQLPTGGGALFAVRSDAGSPVPASGPGNSTGADDALVCLVTDTGHRYPLAGPHALQQLGLAGVSVARVPAAVIRLLPAGPVLDPVTAAAEVTS